MVESCQEEAKWKTEENKNVEKEVMNDISAGVPREKDAAGGGVNQQAVFVAQSTDAGRDPLSKSGLGVGWKEPR